MSCNCKIYQRKFEKMQKKYRTLKNNHKKLLGVAVLLTDALEKFVKREIKTEINETLSTCSLMYPDLFKDGYSEIEKKDDISAQSDNQYIQVANDNGKTLEAATESEREYFEGFMARPKIPRTPQV